MPEIEYILISDSVLSLSRSFSIPLSQVFSDDMNFIPKDIFWRVKTTYNDGKLLVQVLDYDPKDYTGFGRQEVKHSITEIKFENLNRGNLKNFLLNEGNDASKKSIEPYPSTKHPIISDGTEVSNNPPPLRAPRERINHEQFEVLYKNATIKDGMIVFAKKFNWYSLPIQIPIFNSFLKKEFDAIKFYFGKVINGSKRFSVYASITIVDGFVVGVIASSPEIEKINDELIEVIKKERIVKAIRSHVKNEKSLLTADDLFALLDDNDMNILNQSIEEVIDEVMKWDKTRNAKQLQYLSGLKQSNDKKVRFTLKPNIGFMFTITRRGENYYCWELMNSHATYIWAIYGDESDSRIEDIIASIQEVGRNEYKTRYRDGLIDQDTKFYILIHTNKTEAAPFSLWKRQLEDILG